MERIAAEVKNTPDATLGELIENLSLPIKKSQLSRLLIKLGLTVALWEGLSPQL
jgi:hypothetical protein